MMNDATQDPQGRGSSAPTANVAADTTSGLPAQPADDTPASAEEWSDSANDPGSGVPGGGRHKYASGKIYCGTEN